VMVLQWWEEKIVRFNAHIIGEILIIPGHRYCSYKNGVEITMLRFVLIPHLIIAGV